MLAVLPQGPYNNLYNPTCPDYPTCSDEELCNVAKQDAWHDHGGIAGLDSYETASKHLNQNPMCANSLQKNEDTFMFTRVLAPGTDNKFAKPIAHTDITQEDKDSGNIKSMWCNDNPSIYEIPNTLYHPTHIQGRYRVFNISSLDTDETPADAPAAVPAAAPAAAPQSLIQTLFKCLGITDNVFFIRDVAYGNFADDIYNWSRDENGQTATFLITSQGQYDPGPTVTCLTDAGIRIGMGHYIGGSSNRPNRATNPNVHFGIYDIDVESERVTRYPIYPPNNTLNPVPIFSNTPTITSNRNSYTPQAMMSTKFESYMVSEIDFTDVIDDIDGPGNISSRNVDTILSSSNTTLFILDPTDEIGKNSDKRKLSFSYTPTKNIFTIDKNTSNKATTLDSVTRKISTKISGIGITNVPNLPFNSAIYDVLYTSEEICKILSKKFGDHSQAIKTIDPVISYIEFNCLGNHPTSPEFTIKRKKSSGIHVFVTYDRVAATAAIEYGAPIVLFNNKNGFLIYISTNLIEKYSSRKSILTTKLRDYANNYNTFFEKESATSSTNDITPYKDRLTTIAKNIDELMRPAIEIIWRNIFQIFDFVNGITINDDKKYGDFLKVYYVLSPLFIILSDFHNSYENVKKNISGVVVAFDSITTELAENGSAVIPNPNQYIIDDLVDSAEHPDLFGTHNTEIEKRYENNNNIFKNYFTCIASNDKLIASYSLLLFKMRSILEKLMVSHKKKPKTTTVAHFVDLLSHHVNSDDDTYFTNIFETYYFTKAFLGFLPYINDLIEQSTITELSKITPTSVLSNDRISRIFACCITNAGGAIPSFGVSIVKLVYETFKTPLLQDLRNNFERKIYEYFKNVKIKTSESKINMYNMMVQDFYTQTGFTTVELPIRGGDKKKTGFNHTYNKSIYKSSKKTRKNKKLIKGGSPNQIILIRDKLVVSMLLYEYSLWIHATMESSKIQDILIQTLFNGVKKNVATIMYFKQYETQFLEKNVLLLEMFDSVYQSDYLFGELTKIGQLYYRLAQFIIYVFQMLFTNDMLDIIEQINTEKNAFISELKDILYKSDKSDTEYDTVVTEILGLFLRMKLPSVSDLSNFTPIIIALINNINTYTDMEASSNLSLFTNAHESKYALILNYLLNQPNIESTIEHVPINDIIKSQIDKHITQVDTREFSKAYPHIEIPVFGNMSVGEFAQVLSLGASEEGISLLILENYLSNLKYVDIMIIIYNSNYDLIINTIEYIYSIFGNLFFNEYFPRLNYVYTNANPSTYKSIQIINGLQSITQDSKTAYNTRIVQATSSDAVDAIVSLAIKVNDSIPIINGLQSITQDLKTVYNTRIVQATSNNDVDAIVSAAKKINDSIQIINGLQSITQDSKTAYNTRIVQATSSDDVDAIVSEAKKINDSIQIINGLQSITQDSKTAYNTRIVQATSSNAVDAIVSLAIKVNDSIPIINGLQSITQEEKNVYNIRINTADSSDDIDAIVLEAIKTNGTTKIDSLKLINAPSKTAYKTQIDTADSSDDIDAIVSQATNLNEAKDAIIMELQWLTALSPRDKTTYRDAVINANDSGALESISNDANAANAASNTNARASGFMQRQEKYRSKPDKATELLVLRTQLAGYNDELKRLQTHTTRMISPYTPKKIQEIKTKIRQLNTQIAQVNNTGGSSLKTIKHRKQIKNLKHTNKHTKLPNLRKTRRNTKRPKYIKKNVTKRRR